MARQSYCTVEGRPEISEAISGGKNVSPFCILGDSSKTTEVLGKNPDVRPKKEKRGISA